MTVFITTSIGLLSLCEEKKGCIDFERVTPSLLQVKGIAKRNEGDLENAIILLKNCGRD